MIFASILIILINLISLIDWRTGRPLRMSVHQIFAENLRRQCAQFRTISEVCSSIGINRQQFNKYLAGTSIPNSLTLRKICGFFEISEQSLFIDSAKGEFSVTDVRTGFKSIANGPFGFLVASTKNFDFSTDLMHEGAYYCYFRMTNTPGMLVRSLLYLKSQGRFMSFVRLTRFTSADRSTKSFVKGRHRGTIFYNRSEIYFLGTNRYSPFQLSLITIEKSSLIEKNYCSGYTLTRSPQGMLSAPTCIIRASQDEPIKAMIRKLGVVHEADTTVDPVVLFALNN